MKTKIVYRLYKRQANEWIFESEFEHREWAETWVWNHVGTFKIEEIFITTK